MVNMKDKTVSNKKTARSKKATTSDKTRQANALGKASNKQIVDTAEMVLVREGYHGLSTRKVAELCGISVGNLTYHFPNKLQLIEAVMTSVCERYDQQRNEIVQNLSEREPQEYVDNLVAWMLEDAVTEETSALFLELWVLAKHHEFGSEILERFYGTVISWISAGLEFHFPNSTAAARREAAYFLLTLTEGSVAVFSRPKKRPVNHKHITKHACVALMAILTDS